MAPQRTRTLPSICKHGLQILQESLKSCDAVIVAIDFESTANLLNGFRDSEDSQVGLATLDTRNPREIKTYNLITGSLRYTTNAARKFLFGRSLIVEPGRLLQHINSIMPKDRNIIFLGYSIIVELRILGALGFRFSGVSEVLDTMRIAIEVFGFWDGSLGELLGSLQCRFSQLHCGGNDAYFTLRAALALAARGNLDDGTLLNTLEPLLTKPIPNRLDPQVKAEKKKEKRRQRSRKHQSKSWTAEEQDQIRAERAAKRAEIKKRVF